MHTINPIFFLGKYGTKKDRNFYLLIGDVETTRDYAERLKFEFDNEIMSEHFGNYWSLSIEGCSARFLPNPNNTEVKKPQHTLIHTSMMDQSKKKQQQMRNVSFGSLFDEKKNVPIEGGTIFDNTDVSTKKYRSTTALHFLSVLCANKFFCIDQVVG